jgi:hypothetical protein
MPQPDPGGLYLNEREDGSFTVIAENAPDPRHLTTWIVTPPRETTGPLSVPHPREQQLCNVSNVVPSPAREIIANPARADGLGAQVSGRSNAVVGDVVVRYQRKIGLLDGVHLSEVGHHCDVGRNAEWQ